MKEKNRKQLFAEIVEWMGNIRTHNSEQGLFKRSKGFHIPIGIQSSILERIRAIEKLAYERGKKAGYKEGWAAGTSAHR